MNVSVQVEEDAVMFDEIKVGHAFKWSDFYYIKSDKNWAICYTATKDGICRVEFKLAHSVTPLPNTEIIFK